MKEMTLRELQLFSLEIMKDVHQFCMDNHITYSLLDGSLLGAIRHKGFIPWDDDIDIILKRPDYERFCKSYTSDRFKLKYRGNDNNCLVPYARVYDDITTTSRMLTPWCRDDVGVGIDVFPADCVSEVKETFEKHYNRTRKIWHLSNISRAAIGPFSLDKPLLYNIKKFAKKIFFLNGIFTDLFVKKVIKMASATKWGETDYFSQLTSMGDKIKDYHRLDVFSTTVLKPFEDTEFMVMSGYDEYLGDKYKNYMELPPIEKRIAHYMIDTKFYWK